MHRSDAIALAHAYFDGGRFFADLQRRVALRTESDTGQASPSLEAYLREELVPRLAAMGFETSVVPNPQPAAGPFLIARRVEDPALPTVLAYGHGDVTSGQDAHWDEGLEPWVLRARGDRLYGRGTADNKGQHTINLGAMEAVLQARGGRLGYNATWLIEMGEEAASPGLHAVCAAHREALRADLFLASDGPRVNAGRPTLFMGSRGAINFTLRLHERPRAYHSGNWGGVLANPATRLCHAVASLVDARGRITIDGLRPPPVTPAVRQALASIAIGGGAHDPALSPGWGEPGLSPAERLMGWNTLEVLAFGAGQPQRPVNAIPGEAVAHCQLRFVVGTPWQALESIVRGHLDAQGFPDVEVSITLAGAATRLDPDHPWVDWARASIERTAGQAPDILPNLAGSLPNDVFADLLGLPTLWVPHSYPACAQHAPNEHLLAPVAREGLGIMAGLYWDLGETAGGMPPPWTARRPAAVPA
ncbi:M20 family metallopeptidase [Paracidovorax citrulli]|uniref:Peptidase M20 n=2 Tax=Paracidovorax citrulli TaxID=80869 RepID=A1TRU9_PARC0|nr:M20 family metallopeptidase [Paracidovorax citrulli]ABM33687.1 peptidase M20 [Paracidovorax citrulli AAC00-1]ATG94286.1 M20 peptidase family dipeptidase [Paracidovorax citrulli]PVY63119.1 acetylornithine deacetylase/succinyl-diaminopimelate desuccinylase-like protein [Paracidovorax citrulli]QCX12581.1 Succinyl-diaminopimelate desuccinylase [Paracidovorax citrulli]REG67898.1 acetylornithine deacetylase/succinyl-diaminopimelate desuccinylase-like protein [Paracidovorax citrulli]